MSYDLIAISQYLFVIISTFRAERIHLIVLLNNVSCSTMQFVSCSSCVNCSCTCKLQSREDAKLALSDHSDVTGKSPEDEDTNMKASLM